MERESLTPDQVEGVLGQLFAAQSAILAEACRWLMVADRNQQWLADGAATPAQWLSARFGLRHSTASQVWHVARRLESLPALQAELAAGSLSLDQADALSKMATPETEEALLEETRGLSNAALDRAARRARIRREEDERTVWERRRLSLQWNLDESELRFGGNLPGHDGKILERAVRERAESIPPNPETGLFDTYQARLADGLVELAATSGGGDGEGTPPQVTIHADLGALTSDTETTGVAEIQEGPVIANQTARRLACDAIIETAVYDDCRILGVGRRTRTIPGWLRRQLWYRDHGCQFPGCHHTRWIQGHHIIHWADGGPTDLDNLVLLCSYHHRFIHELGWQIRRHPGGRLSFHRPDGTVYPPAPPRLDPRLQELTRTI